VPTNLNQTNIQPVYDIYASVQGRDLGIGLLFAAVLVYFLMVVNYQNFGDPLVVILALPATLCGILTMLFITGTTLSVPSLMGAIMAVGVASANSILLVTFARQPIKDHRQPSLQ
jgi:multidrug efflux pump subunit AcrB